MDGKTSEWRPGPTVCRCCLTEGCYKDISTEYFWMGKREVYSEMLSETFNVSIAYSQSGGPNSNSRLICEPCISKLRDASEFKRQVQECEKTFIQHLDPGTSVVLDVETAQEQPDKSVKLERVKLEKHYSDDDIGGNDFAGGGDADDADEDDDDDLDDQPLTKFVSKVPKKESVDILDLLDNSQLTVKRKSKTKAPPAKKVKLAKKETPVKATASKPVTKPVEKKKKEKDPKIIARRNAEVIVIYTTAYPFRLPEGTMVCVFCTESFSDPAVFREHMKNEHKKFTLQSAFAHIPTCYYIKVDCTDLRCRLCTRSFDSLDEIALHLKSEHFLMHKFNLKYDLGVQPFRLADNKLSCVFCSLRFPNLRGLSRHTHSHFAKYTCEKCGKTFSTWEPLKKHVQFGHVGEQRVCWKCKTIFESLEARNQHLRESEKCWQNVCNICGTRFRTYTMKKTHLVEVHGHSRSTYSCPECPEVFVSHKQRRRHFFKCHANTFKCSCCDRKFPSQRALDEHKLRLSTEILFCCDICSRQFPKKATLQKHIRKHSEVKRFHCELCNKQFNQRARWKTHMKTKHPEVVDVCETVST